MAATHAAAFTRSRPWSKAEFTALMQNAACFTSGGPVCFALARVILDEAELLTIATHPDRQRHGLARACMVDWQATARQRGASRAFLEVASDNLAAIALYRSGGFETCGLRPGYYTRPGSIRVDALVMARDLT